VYIIKFTIFFVLLLILDNFNCAVSSKSVEIHFNLCRASQIRYVEISNICLVIVRVFLLSFSSAPKHDFINAVLVRDIFKLRSIKMDNEVVCNLRYLIPFFFCLLLTSKVCQKYHIL